MPRVRPMTEEARRAERNAKRDNAFRAGLGAYRMTARRTLTEIAAAAGMPLRTLQRRIEVPETMTVRELRAINDTLPTGQKITGEVIGA